MSGQVLACTDCCFYHSNNLIPAGLSSSPLPVIVSVICLFAVLLVLLVAVRVHRKRHRSAAETSVDEWEINLGDLMLLEKIGEGFFGDVLKAHLYRKPHLDRKLSRRLKMRSKVWRDTGDKENKLVVACKRVKGTNVLLPNAISYSQKKLLSSQCFRNLSVGTNLEDEADFVEEIKLMKRIGRHPHIVGMLACVTKAQPLCLIVEYCCHGDLLNYLRKGRPKVCSRIDFFYS